MHIKENVGTETQNVASGIHSGGMPHNNLCYHCMVVCFLSDSKE
jgi:hypothetical protein